MNEKALNDEELMQLESLVDGELPDTQYGRLLSRLDEAPNGWKTCALAFLEHQALEKAMRTFTQSALAEPMLATVVPKFDSQQECMKTTVHWTRTELPSHEIHTVSDASEHTGKMTAKADVVTIERASMRRSANILLMLAASVAIAFTSGFLTKQWQTQNSLAENERIATNANTAPTSQQTEVSTSDFELANQIAAEGFDPNQTYEIDPATADFPSSLESSTNLPVNYTGPIDSSMLESREKKIVRLNSLVDAEMEQVQSFVPYTRADGQEIVVPVQNLKFRPIAVHGF